MLNSAVLDLMMARLGKRTAPTMRQTCLTELNIAIRELERAPVKPWFLESTATGQTADDDEGVDVPPDFLMEIEEGTLELRHPDNGWVELTKVTREKARIETKNADPAFPEGYYLWGNRIIFAPNPDQAYDYRFDYYARSTPVVDSGAEATNSWINEFFDLVVYKALIVVARDHIQSDRMATNFGTSFSGANGNFMREVEARKVANETLLLTDEES